ncbi:unnamed protein product, partial [Prorocentrum cordatum]
AMATAERTAIRNILGYYNERTYEAPSAWLSIQDGQLNEKVKQLEEGGVPAHQCISQVSGEVIQAICTAARPSPTAPVWLKIKAAHKKAVSAGGAEKTRPEFRIFNYLAAEHPTDGVVANSRALPCEVYEKAADASGERPLVIQAGLAINWAENGAFKLTGEQEVSEGVSHYRAIQHVSGAEAFG